MELKVTRANPSSQSMVVGPAVVASLLGNLLEKQILRPLSRCSNWKPEQSLGICVLTRSLDDFNAN